MSTPVDRPNIVFLFSDQQRWDTVGAYGRIESITPNLDRMASEGVLFENAFTCQPVCGPARACIQTGKYATETGCFVNNIALPQDEQTIAHVFNDAGYQTAYVGKWHLASTGDHQNYRTRPVPPERRGGWSDYWVAAQEPWSGTAAPGSEVYEERFLYDLDADPDETNNRVTDPALGEVRRELAERLKHRMVQAGEAEPEVRPASRRTR